LRAAGITEVESERLKHEIALERLVGSVGMKLTRHGEGLMGPRLPATNRAAGAEIRGRLQKLGALRESGHEFFKGWLEARRN